MNIFVTGGSRGIGRAIVLEAARQGWGCAFTYVSRREAAAAVLAEAQAIAPDATFATYALDVGDSAQVETVIDQACDALGDIHAVVNNAGIVNDGAVFSMTDEKWQRVLDTNLTGSFYVMRGFLMHFLSNRRGHFVSISSMAQDGSSGQANYAAAKAGLVGLSRTVAKEYGPKGITANVIVPGYVDTGMTRDHMSDQLKEYWMTFCPGKRLGTEEELAKLVLFLSGETGDFINGETIWMTGGLNYAP